MNKLKVCVYAICKNEEKFVSRWVESMSEADEIYVLDTGSCDDTVQKLKDLVLKYEEEFIYEGFIKPAYTRRSKLVHEGIPRTREIYSGYIFPLVNISV